MTNTKSAFLVDTRILATGISLICLGIIFHKHHSSEKTKELPCENKNVINSFSNQQMTKADSDTSQQVPNFIQNTESTGLFRAVELKNKTYQNFVFLNQMPMAAAKSMHYLLNALSEKNNFTYTHQAYPEKESTLYSGRWIEHMNQTENLMPAVLNGITKNSEKMLCTYQCFM